MEDILFTPFKLGKLQIPNRFVRSACFEAAANSDGSITEQLIRLYKDLSSGGAGLAITGFAYVDSGGRCLLNQIGVHTDEMILGLQKLTGTIHGFSKNKIAIQLVHGGRQVKPYTAPVMAPSAVPFSGTTPVPLREKEIKDIIESFATAAKRAKDAGFDGVQLHAAHGFLISQFISPFTNRRNDAWGGTPEKRRRFFIEIIGRCREEVGGEYPLFAKINCRDFIEGGLELEESIQTAVAAQNAGLDAIEISGGIWDSPPELGTARKGIDSRKKEAYFLQEALQFKAKLGIPVILVGGIRSAQVARKIIGEDGLDAVAMCRPLIREPDLPEKIRNRAARSRCVSCNGCFINTGGMTHCALE